jgi:midasin (ATPase involved in ribosome maturation)
MGIFTLTLPSAQPAYVHTSAGPPEPSAYAKASADMWRRRRGEGIKEQEHYLMSPNCFIFLTAMRATSSMTFWEEPGSVVSVYPAQRRSPLSTE